jgi:LuxR family transcriptional regulator, maltose regulon positive regulatory protein
MMTMPRSRAEVAASMGPAATAPPRATRATPAAAGQPRTWPVPSPPDRLLLRPRLDDRIGQGAGCRLTLVTGSAGQGKTTAVAEALRGRSLVWVTLEPSDRAPRRLHEHLLRAFDGATDGIDVTAPPDGSDDPIELLVHRLARLDREILVLDDRADAIQRASAGLVTRLLDRMPDDARVVLISRRRPVLGIEQRRARGEVDEILDDELAFTPAEAASYLNDGWSLGLTEAVVRELVELTDGWPAALRLVAAHLASARDRGETTPSATVAVERATDGLVRELLESVGSADRRLLQDIAVLDELDPDVCTRLTGHEDASEPLEHLAAAGLLRRSGAAYRTYRHRGLVRAHLLRELRARHPERETALHEVAAAWYASREAWTTAIGHAIAAGDDRWALEWLDSHLETLVTIDGGEWLRTVMANFTTASVATRPRLLDAWLDVAMLRGDRGVLERALVALEGAPTSPGGHSDALRRARAYLARLRGDGVEPLLVHRDHRTLDPEVAHPLGAALAAEGRHDAASAAFRRALDDARRRHEPFRELALLGDAAWQQAIAGYLVDADFLTRRAAELASVLDLEAPPLTALLAGAQIALDRGRIEVARSQAATVRAVAADACDLVLRVDAGLFVSRARWAQGDVDGAVRVLEETEKELREHVPGGGLLSRLARSRASMRLALDDPQGAIAALPAIAGDVASLPPEDRLIAASVHLRLKAADRAREAIGALADEGIGPRLTVHALRIEASAIGMEGDLGEATRLRRQADRIARGRGLLTPVVHRRVARPDRDPAVRSDGTAAVGTGHTTVQAEALTDRELDVLRMLPTATNVQIAADLYVSVNTVKTHLKSVYRKLDVASRDAAVHRGRVAGLI